MIRRLFLIIMSSLKGREIALDPNIPPAYLFGLSLRKAISLFRGALLSRKMVYVGRATRIHCVKKFYPGKGVEIGMFCQVDCLSKNGLVLGHSSKIGDFSLIRVSGSLSDLGSHIRIGNNVGIGDFAHIGGAGGVCIGDNTITGSYLSIHPENHHFEDTQIPIRLQGVSRKGIRIGCDCWIGAKVTFLDGAAIGDGCVVAAGAVVTGQFGDNLVLAGVPAKVVRSRGCA